MLRPPGRSLPDWIGSHTRALAFFDGATQHIVPDQWRAGVQKPCYWEPELNRTYQEWATHNGVAIVPARPGHARDKTCVSYCTLFRINSGQNWLRGSTTTVPFNNSRIPDRFVQGMIAVV